MQNPFKKIGEERRLFLGFLLFSLLLLCVMTIGLRSSARRRDSGRWIAHTRAVMAEAQEARFDAAQFDGAILPAHREMLFERMQTRIQNIKSLTSDNPAQQSAAERLKTQMGAERRSAAPENDRMKTDAVFETLDAIMREEDCLLKQRRAASEREAAASDAALAALSAAIIAALGWGCWRIRQANRRQKQASEKIANVLESVRDGFFAVDRNWNFVYVNGEAKRMWGMEGAELIGQNLWEVHSDACGTEFERQNNRALSEQIVVQYEEYYPTHGIWYEVKVFPTAEGLSLYFRDVTSARGAAQALKRSEKALQDAQELAHIGSWEADLVADATYCSPEVYRIYGMEDLGAARITLERVMERIYPEDREKALRVFKAARNEGTSYEMEYRIVLPTGELRHVETRGQVAVENGVPVRMAGTVQDVTDRKRAEERFAALFEQAADPHFLLDGTGIIDCNAAAIATLGCESKAELLSLHPAVFSPHHQPDGRLSKEKAAEMDALAHRNGSHRFEWTHRNKKGKNFPVEVILTPITLKDKSVLLAVTRDLTERKRAEEELRQSHAKLAALLVAIPDILFRINRDGVCIDFIADRKQHTLYTAEQCVGRHLREVLPSEVAQLMQDTITRALETKSVQSVEYTLAVKGQPRYREARITAQSEDEALIIVRDVTDRKNMERRLDAVNRQNALLLESVGEGIYGIDLQGNGTFANPAAEKLLGYTAAEMIGQNIHALIHYARADGSPYPATECPIYRAMRGSEIFRNDDEVFWRKEGASFPVECFGAPIQENGQTIGMVVCFSDITARKMLEEQIEEQMLTMNEYSVELEFQKAELQNANARLETLATTDGLTGLKNHREFQRLFAEEFERCARYGLLFSVLLLDIDHFKQFNDTFGHPSGDRALKQVAGALTLAARTSDRVARYGGEEFAIILPTTDAQGAMEAAERFRAAVERQEWVERPVTVSIGVATWNLEAESPAALLQQADTALYASKRAGRNRATHYADETRTSALSGA